MADLFYRIQNRTAQAIRTEITKYNGSIVFSGNPPATYAENATYAGWCMSEYTPAAFKEPYALLLQLSTIPMGVVGRVTLTVNNVTVVQKYDFTGLPISARIDWFNANFGDYVYCVGKYQPCFYPMVTDQIFLSFEDDDVDFTQLNVVSIAGDTQLTVEPYRLSFTMQSDYAWMTQLENDVDLSIDIGDVDLTYNRYRTDNFNLQDDAELVVQTLPTIWIDPSYLSKLTTGHAIYMWNTSDVVLMWSTDSNTLMWPNNFSPLLWSADSKTLMWSANPNTLMWS